MNQYDMSMQGWVLQCGSPFHSVPSLISIPSSVQKILDVTGHLLSVQMVNFRWRCHMSHPHLNWLKFYSIFHCMYNEAQRWLQSAPAFTAGISQYNPIQLAKYCNLIGWLRATELDYIVKCPQCLWLDMCGYKRKDGIVLSVLLKCSKVKVVSS